MPDAAVLRHKVTKSPKSQMVCFIGCLSISGTSTRKVHLGKMCQQFDPGFIDMSLIRKVHIVKTFRDLTPELLTCPQLERYMLEKETSGN